ncbi:hypothetical protein [Tsuneonella mangrovi]|uniref:hypothetical protein n=1 Tax=Tsuneonella mangrovi TaxID=1982042 RepID=UPI001F0A132B|nr:hypothetical protein [Tsuneonella mangrovi]
MIRPIRPFVRRMTPLAVIATSLLPAVHPVVAQDQVSGFASEPTLTYADLADLSDAASEVVHVRVSGQIALPPERAPSVAPGMVRLYVEADTLALISGSAPLGESVKYLVDVPLDPRGKAPKLKKREFILFARAVPGRPDELQLVGPGAQQPWTPDLEARLRPILTAMAATDAPPVVTGVRDVLAVPGNLVGESETQMFLSTQSGDPVSISIVRRPGMAPVWGVSYSEIVDQAARPPQRDTLAWYRLACFLPQQLPGAANLTRDATSRQLAVADYAFVIRQLGPCERTLATR